MSDNGASGSKAQAARTLVSLLKVEDDAVMFLDRSGSLLVATAVLPNADHAMLVWPGAANQSHWPTLAPGYVDMMTDWITRVAARQ